jgi:hypothetical protein
MDGNSAHAHDCESIGLRAPTRPGSVLLASGPTTTTHYRPAPAGPRTSLVSRRQLAIRAQPVCEPIAFALLQAAEVSAPSRFRREGARRGLAVGLRELLGVLASFSVNSVLLL